MKDGDLLNDTAEALVNAVNTKGVMGKGIALAFRNKYPDMYTAYRHQCLRGLVIPGKVYYYRLPTGTTRYIVNFPTKRSWRNPADIDYIISGLDSLATFITASGIKTIAIPMLGCGLGGLNWVVVRALIETKLQHLDVTIHLYVHNEEAVRH